MKLVRVFKLISKQREYRVEERREPIKWRLFPKTTFTLMDNGKEYFLNVKNEKKLAKLINKTHIKCVNRINKDDFLMIKKIEEILVEEGRDFKELAA